MEVVVSTFHQIMKFPTSKEVEKSRNNEKQSQVCYILVTESKAIGENLPIDGIDLQDELQNKRPLSLSLYLSQLGFRESEKKEDDSSSHLIEKHLEGGWIGVNANLKILLNSSMNEWCNDLLK